MAKFIIEGGIPLRGATTISGGKNAALPILAASLLTTGICRLTNLPDIEDVTTMLAILEGLGVKINRHSRHELTLNAAKLNKSQPHPQLVQRLRASILIAGALLTRTGRCRLFHPGGCVIGRRPIDTHLEAFSRLGIKIKQENDYYQLTNRGLRGRRIFLDEVSVTATENAIMAACLARGVTAITPAACEPHVVDLCRFLSKLGYQINGAGTHTIIITGNNQLSAIDIEHRLVSDEVETGTLAIAILATKGQATLNNVPADNLDCIIHKLRAMGGLLNLRNDQLLVEYPAKPLMASKIQVDTWPRLPTDLQPPLTVLATQASGNSLIHDWIYERRLGHIDELTKMGAEIILCDLHRAIVCGPTPLYGNQIISPDIRAGIAFVLAGLVAKGKTTVEHIELIERGYENIENKLRQLGANIKRIES